MNTIVATKARRIYYSRLLAPADSDIAIGDQPADDHGVACLEAAQDREVR
jgi:hypothetical protein